MSSTSATSRDFRPFLLLLAAIVILLDRLSKIWIEHHVERGHTITLIPNIFRISHVLNTGAAMGLFGSVSPEVVRDALIAFSLIAVLVVLLLIWRMGRAYSLTGVAWD